MAKRIRKLKKSLSPTGDQKIKKLRRERIRETKSLNTLGRLEANHKRVLLKHHLDNLRRDSIESKKFIRHNNEIYFRRDSEICRERKLRKADIMAKSGGRGFRVRIAHWTPDSFIQCR